MKETKTTTVFKCDNCGKELGPVMSSEDLYKNNWIYLYKVNGKVESEKIIDRQDCHFCKLSCMLEFVGKVFAANSEKRDKGDKDGKSIPRGNIKK